MARCSLFHYEPDLAFCTFLLAEFLLLGAQAPLDSNVESLSSYVTDLHIHTALHSEFQTGLFI